jgi:thiamine-phosphate pyrophosphorylase
MVKPIINETPITSFLIGSQNNRMPIVLITPPVTLPSEHLILNAMLNLGLQRVHLRKPGQSLEEYDTYIQQINPDYRNRITLHDFHELSSKFSLGVHYRERQIPHNLITAPSPTQIVSLGFHTPQELLIDRGDVGYCFLSPIYESISKSGYFPGAQIADRKVLSQFISKSRYPVVALGGKSLFQTFQLAVLKLDFSIYF